MNEQNPTPPGPFPPTPPPANPGPPVIPPIAPPLPPRDGQAPGANAQERVPISGVVTAVEAILRQPRRVMFQLQQVKPSGLIGALLVIAVGCSLVYGLVVGTFSGGSQLWAAPVKIAAGLLISGLICLPSLYIFSCLGGSQARLVEVSGLVAGLLALMTILLIGFAPVAWVFSQSTQSTVVMGVLHLGFAAVAMAFGVRFLSGGFSQLNAKSGGGLNTWVVIFVLVCLQMTTALRPIVGKSDRFLPAASDKKFFASYWMDCLQGEGQSGTAVAAPGR